MDGKNLMDKLKVYDDFLKEKIEENKKGFEFTEGSRIVKQLHAHYEIQLKTIREIRERLYELFPKLKDYLENYDLLTNKKQ